MRVGAQVSDFGVVVGQYHNGSNSHNIPKHIFRWGRDVNFDLGKRFYFLAGFMFLDFMISKFDGNRLMSLTSTGLEEDTLGDLDPEALNYERRIVLELSILESYKLIDRKFFIN